MTRSSIRCKIWACPRPRLRRLAMLTIPPRRPTVPTRLRLRLRLWQYPLPRQRRRRRRRGRAYLPTSHPSPLAPRRPSRTPWRTPRPRCSTAGPSRGPRLRLPLPRVTVSMPEGRATCHGNHPSFPIRRGKRCCIGNIIITGRRPSEGVPRRHRRLSTRRRPTPTSIRRLRPRPRRSLPRPPPPLPLPPPRRRPPHFSKNSPPRSTRPPKPNSCPRRWGRSCRVNGSSCF
mmetsp:Transcript_31031/g.59555  ORF Transcript_31031/g.59555 Transcript_31031/m.59555 type:complete len:230 (+) Transcript_31031:572-1261(+)